MGKARPRELNSHRKKLEKIKKMKRLGKQKQNVEELTNKRDRKLHIWIERKDN